MRIVCLFAAPFLLSAQDTKTYVPTTVDINGYRVASGPQVTTTDSKSGAEMTEKVRSINGRTVPLEKIEDHVLRDDASGKVIERIIRRYDPTGNPGTPEKVLIEEQKGPNGASTITSSTYRGDVNGRMQLIEKTMTRTGVTGDTKTSETAVERPSVNDTLQVVEKQSVVQTKQPGGYQENVVTLRKDQNGSFYPAVRKVTEHTERGGQTVDNTAEYEVGSSGNLELHGQTVSRSTKRPDGSTDTVVDILGRNVPGVVNDSGALKLKEQQVIERKPGPGKSVVETLSVRRPSVSDPNVLGPATQISETTCRGNCQPKDEKRP